MKKALVSLLLVLSLLLGTVGCFAEATLPMPAAASAKDTLTIISAKDANGFCPVTSGYSPIVLLVTNNVYEGLITRDGGGTIIPRLASSYEWADDNMALTFKLREDVYFHNGDHMTADDVVWSYKEHYLNSSYGKSETYFDFANMEKLDAYTVRIPMLKQAGDALAVMCDTMYYIMSKRAVEEFGEFYAVNPVGTGPYTFVSYTEGDQIVMKANANYWRGKPAIDNLVVRIIPESTQAMIEMENGNADAYVEASFESINQALNGGCPGIGGLQYGQGTITNLRFNWRKDWTKNKAVRECMNYAINKSDIVIAAYEGLVQTANQNMSRAFKDAYISEYDEAPLYSYDPEKAKAKLAESGYKPGELQLELNIDQTINIGIMAQLIKKNLEDVGIGVTINVLDSQAWVGTILGGNGDLQISIASKSNGYPIYYLVMSNPAHTPNWDDMASYPEGWEPVYACYSKALTLNDGAEISKVVQQGVRIMAEEALTVPLVEAQSYVLLADTLKGIVFTDNRIFDFTGAYFE